MTVVADWGFEQAPPQSGDVPIPGSPGWSVVYGLAPDPAHGSVQLATDPAAPLSAPAVYDVVYPEGMVEGLAPTTVYYPRSSYGIRRLWRRVFAEREGLGSSDVYVGLWWKPSAPFDLGPNGNKIAFHSMAGRRASASDLLPTDGCTRGISRHFAATPTPAGTVGIGAAPIEWHQTSACARVVPTACAGPLHRRHELLRLDVFAEPDLGRQAGARKRETDHYWFDHVRLSVR